MKIEYDVEFYGLENEMRFNKMSTPLDTTFCPKSNMQSTCHICYQQNEIKINISSKIAHILKNFYSIRLP